VIATTSGIAIGIGPVIATATVEILPDDTYETFSDRLRAAEHKLIVEAVGKVLKDAGKEA